MDGSYEPAWQTWAELHVAKRCTRERQRYDETEQATRRRYLERIPGRAWQETGQGDQGGHRGLTQAEQISSEAGRSATMREQGGQERRKGQADVERHRAPGPGVSGAPAEQQQTPSSGQVSGPHEHAPGLDGRHAEQSESTEGEPAPEPHVVW